MQDESRMRRPSRLQPLETQTVQLTFVKFLKPMRRFFSLAIFISLGGLLAVLAGCSKSKSQAAIDDVKMEINEVFEKFKKASLEDDFEKVFETSTRESIKRMIFETVRAMGSTAGSTESEVILTKYIDQAKLQQLGQTLQNPSPDQIMELYMASIARPKEMFIESCNYLARKEPDRKAPVFGELENLQISGNRASAQTTVKLTLVELMPGVDGKDPKRTVKESTQEVTVYFVRIGGQWLFGTKLDFEMR